MKIVKKEKRISEFWILFNVNKNDAGRPLLCLANHERPGKFWFFYF